MRRRKSISLALFTMKTNAFRIFLALVPSLVVFEVSAQAYFLDCVTIAGGGGDIANGTYSATLTIGQPVANAPASAGPFSFSSGFWSLFSGTNSSSTSGAGLVVNPLSALEFFGANGGPFAPLNQGYGLSNTSTNPVAWNASNNAN